MLLLNCRLIELNTKVFLLFSLASLIEKEWSVVKTHVSTTQHNTIQ